MKKLLKKLLFGITLPQEYLCVNLNEFEKPLRISINDKHSNQAIDLTEHHLFIGYKPLVIAVDKKYLTEDDLNKLKNLSLILYSDNGKKLASIEMKQIHEVKFHSMNCILFEGVKGTHSFTNSVHKILNSLRYNLTADREKNVFLDGNLYEQVKIAYAIPRKIYLASVGSNGLFNIFPTDISGQLSDEVFIVSLRRQGKANEQIEKERKCLVAQMDADSFNEVYNAGKNHMKNLSDANQLGIKLHLEFSDKFDLPIPLGTVKYYELEKVNEFEIGIHTIHFFKIINAISISEKNSTLAHIHREFAEWRRQNGIHTNYLIRNL
jgi:flavin reductase (DIM6/NTAB) family NADH-FMN oxidoreductase RutF